MKLLTATWSEDQPHFGLLKFSLASSGLADLPHEVIVQTEDLGLFQPHQDWPTRLRPSIELLDPSVEAQRLSARRRQKILGRRATTVSGSLSRYLGWPTWVRYTGWQVQQISKLAAVASSSEKIVVILDSDLVVSPRACPEDFIGNKHGSIVYHQRLATADELSPRNRNWLHTAYRLLKLPIPGQGPFDVYFDTPFVMHTKVVRSLLQWLESTYGRPWWQILLSLPPRRWSEFAIYRLFLRQYHPALAEWRGDKTMGYIYDAGNSEDLMRQFRSLLSEKNCRYITIHSHSAGKQGWTPENYLKPVKQCLQRFKSLVACNRCRD